MTDWVLPLAALTALAPAAILPLVRPAASAERDVVFWLVMAAAFAGSAAWTWIQFAAGWRTGLGPALWLTVTCTGIMYVLSVLMCPVMVRLLGLLGPYFVLLAGLATAWSGAEARPVSDAAPEAWLAVHISVSVATYALFTLAAIAGFGVALQESALKSRRPSRFAARLPSVAEGEAIQRRLMAAAAAVLALGLASGMAIQFLETGQLLVPSHKVLLALLAFVVIVVLLAVDRWSGLAGRRISRFLLSAYLLLTLAYPGVKFVTDVILARG